MTHWESDYKEPLDLFWLWLILAIVCMVMLVWVGFATGALKVPPDYSTVSCDYFRDYPMKQIPARCISYFQKP